MATETELAELQEYLAIPYVAVVYSVDKGNGEWLRRAEYPELPDCAAEADSADDAMQQLEEERVRILLDFHARGEVPPRPRPPLTSGVSGLSAMPVEVLMRKFLLSQKLS